MPLSLCIAIARWAASCRQSRSGPEHAIWNSNPLSADGPKATRYSPFSRGLSGWIV